MTDHDAMYKARVAATKRFGKIQLEDGTCICAYCNEDDDHWHPASSQRVSQGGSFYNCLNCHTWTDRPSGYCIHCDHGGYNQAEDLVDGGCELPAENPFEQGTVAFTKFMLAKESARVPGLLFGPGKVHPNYMFRHKCGKWYPLGSDVQLAYRTMKVIADYFQDVTRRLGEWQPSPESIDKYWDAELARENDY